jgi:hypothetical protein
MVVDESCLKTLAPSGVTSSFATVYLPVPGHPVREKTYDTGIVANCKSAISFLRENAHRLGGQSHARTRG